ncbi:antA/AntB antirepressor family protein [Acinetobacter puyangensis]|uniref:antA/AntB antirepressor family protein n=1 Tax=Acinetobacter puyangensis TaxID=1096779 RepID=UPI003A4E0D93
MRHECKFEENYDFIIFVKNDENPTTGRPTTEYIISVDMAKHLGMMERNDKGHEIRKFYIEQEKVARQLNDGIPAQIAKVSVQINIITQSLSHAGSFLAVHGKQTKPKLLKQLDGLIERTQHKLPLNE